MEVIQEGRLHFSFPSDANVAKYDEWAFYRNQFNSAFGGTKAIDLVYVDTEQTWLIEVKDYRTDRRTKAIDLADEISLKVRDTLVGLTAGKFNCNDRDEKKLASLALRRKRLKVVLHLEQPRKPSKLFPKIVDPSKLLMKLRQKLKAVDAHPAVVDQNSLKPDMNWSVAG